MNLRILNVTFLLLALPLISYTQKNEDAKNDLPKLRLGSASIAIGAATDLTPSLNLQDFQKLAPNSVLLQNDLSGFSSNDYYYNSSAFAFSVQVGIDFLDKDKTSYDRGLQLRIGLNYLGSMDASYSLTKADYFITDTLQSLQTGELTFVDSTDQQDYNMDYMHDQLQLDLSLVYTTRTKSFLSLYAGVGICAGVSVVSRTQISYNSSNNNDLGDYVSLNEGMTEHFYNGSNFSVAGYLPIGLELRLGRNRALWNQLKLFTEMRPGISYFHSSDLVHSRSIPWYQQTLGIRYIVL